MIRNYIKIAYRNIIRNKRYSLINLLGMTLGFIGSFILLLYVINEWSYDRYHQYSDRIYRINSNITLDENPYTIASAPTALSDAFQKEYPNVAVTVRFNRMDMQVKNPTGRFVNQTFFFTDPTVFNVFSYKLLAGKRVNPLAQPYTVVISQDLAKRYFGAANPVGKHLTIAYSKQGHHIKFQVTGVMENVPENSHFIPEALVSYSTLEILSKPKAIERWGNFNTYTYVFLPTASSPEGLGILFNRVFKKYAPPAFDKFNAKVKFHLQPLTDIYLNTPEDLDNQFGNQGDVAYIYIFLSIAIFILVVVVINYTNLAIARSTRRAKEIGVRKVLGAFRERIIGQFLFESVILSLIAYCLSLSIIDLLIPYINDFFGKSLLISIWQHPGLIACLFILSLIVGLAGGYYPAIYLSRFEAASILKGKGLSDQPTLRKGLIVIQQAIAMVMLIGTMVIYQQIHFLNTKNLGFQKDKIVRIAWFASHKGITRDEMKTVLMQHPSVKSVAAAYGSPGTTENSMGIRAGKEQQNLVAGYIPVDEAFIPTLGIQLNQGKNFDASARDGEQVIINEKMAKTLHWDDPVGKVITYGMEDSLDQRTAVVIGVVDDFHLTTLRKEISPLFLFCGNNNYSNLFVRLSGENTEETLRFIEEQWNQHITDHTFSYHFLADDFNENYLDDNQKARLLRLCCFLIVLITTLGLFGLSAYTTQQRNKELNIRKIIGASPWQLFVLVTREYYLLSLVAIAIAWPIAFVIMYQWLNHFAYHVSLSAWPFIGAAFFTVLITMSVVGLHALHAIRSNPAKAIKEN